MHPPPLLSSVARTRLRQYVLLLSSDKPGEVVNAAGFIGRTLRAAGWNWHDFADLLTKPNGADASATSIRPYDNYWIAKFCFERRHTSFVEGMVELAAEAELTIRQKVYLHNLYRRLGGEG